jgi:ABC-2 type transport system permease protein
MSPGSLQRISSVASKELLHILRDPMTLFFAVFVPLLQLFLLGYAINTNVRDIRTVVLDQARTQESRAVLRRFENSHDFKIVAQVYSDEELTQAIVAGKARVGIKVPHDYSDRIEAGQTSQLLVLVDGSESSIAAEAVNVSNTIALRESLERILGSRQLPVEARPRVLFNPDTRSANFFIPGLMVILCQMMTTMMAATAIVREKEHGTLEQLAMTPVRPGELIVGKMVPYLGLVCGEFCLIAFLMWLVFGVPIHGHFATLMLHLLPFLLTMLGVGLLISTKASTREAAAQMTMGTVLPSVFLSSYIFPGDSMPWFFEQVSLALPTTWMIDASRGVILRGAGLAELWVNLVVLWGMALAILAFSSFRLKRLA